MMQYKVVMVELTIWPSGHSLTNEPRWNNQQRKQQSLWFIQLKNKIKASLFNSSKQITDTDIYKKYIHFYVSFAPYSCPK